MRLFFFFSVKIEFACDIRCMPTSNFQPIRLLDPDYCSKLTYLMANSADPDQLASSEAN